MPDNEQLDGINDVLETIFDNLPGWLSTNEFDDLLNNIKATEALLGLVKTNSALWKWVLLSSHASLQSLAVCKLTRTDGFGAMTDEIERQMQQFYQDKKDTFHNADDFAKLSSKQHVATFPVLMRRLGYKVPTKEGFQSETNLPLRALYILHEHRNTFLHYPPISFSVKEADLVFLVKTTFSIISHELSLDNWKRRPLIVSCDIDPLLNAIDQHFADLHSRSSGI